VPCAQLPKGNTLMMEPLAEVLDHFDVETYCGTGVARASKSLTKGTRIMQRWFAAIRLRAKALSKICSITAKPEIRWVFKVPPHFLLLPTAAKCKPKTDFAKTSPSHNYDLSIIIAFASAHREDLLVQIQVLARNRSSSIRRKPLPYIT